MIDVPYEVKKALREGTYRKNYRFIVLHDDWTEDFTIDNDNLVKESVSIDERMCSGDTIKYGLCEGSSLEFQYFMPEKGQYEANKTYMRNDLVHSNGVAWRSRTDNNTGNPLVEGDYWAEWVKPNITGRRVQAFVDVDYKKVITQYSWETQEQFSTAFTVTDMSGDCRLYTERDSAWDFAYVTENGTTTQVYPTSTESGTIIELGDVTGRTLIVSLPVIPAPTADLQLLVPHVGPAILTHPIPLGFFDVKKCSRQASTGIIKVTAYNKLQSEYLDAKANDAVINELDDPSTMLSIYGVRKILLEGYEITPYEESEIIGAIGNTFSETPNISIRFSNLTDGSTPFSAVNLKHLVPDITPSTSRPIYIMFYSHAEEYRVYPENHYYQYRQISDVMSKFTYWVVDYIKNVIDDSPLNITGQQFINAINTVWNDGYGHSCDGWEEVCSINNRNQGLSSTFMVNDWAYENGVSASSHPTTGTVNDLSKQLINPSAYQYIRVMIPFQMILEYWINNNTRWTISLNMLGDTEYFDGQETKLYPGMKYEDGTAITLDNLIEKMGVFEILNISPADAITVDPSTMQDYTLREITSAAYETQCQFGQLSRITDLFAGVELGHSRLLPAETLYPATDLYPSGARLSGSKAMYSKLWADEGNIHKWRYLIITYKGLDEEQNEKEFTLQRTVNSDGTDDYNCSDNWLFRNLIWTDEQIGDYADAMVAKMQGITWFPFEMWCAGLPYLETGDEIEIPLGDQKYVSYVLQRQLKGIQNLQDTYINGTLDIY